MDAAASFALFKQHLIAVSPLSDSEVALIANEVRIVKYHPGETFGRAGERTEAMGVVLDGVFRVYYLKEDGSQLVRRFIPEGRVLGDITQQLTGEPALVTIEALLPSEVAVVRYGIVEGLYDRYPNWQRFGRKLIERYYLMLEQREYQFLAFSATERYRIFRRDYPGLEDRVSQANIASYLGINPVTLSRIRSAKARP